MKSSPLASLDARRKVTQDRIATADTYLNDVDFPGYLEVAGALSRVLVDCAASSNSDALSAAREVLRRLDRSGLLA